MIESHGLSSLWPGFNFWPWRSVSRDFPWLITHAALCTVLGRRKARPNAETVIESGVVPPCEKLLPKQSAEEMSTDQDGLSQTEKKDC